MFDIGGFVQSFKGKRVLVIGDLMLDVLIDHEMSKASAEFDGPVYKELGRYYYPGGAANVAMNCRSLGAEVKVAGPIGFDLNGELLYNRLRSAGVHVSTRGWNLVEAGWYDTTVKTRFSINGKLNHRIDKDIIQAIKTDQMLYHMGLWRTMGEEYWKFDALLLSDYNKGAFSEDDFCYKVIDKFKEYNPKAMVCVAPKPGLHLRLPDVDLISANDSEFKEMVGPCPNKEPLRRARYVMRTLGSKGIQVYRDGYSHSKAYYFYGLLNPDVCGCGDSAFAAASLALTVTEDEIVLPCVAVSAGTAKANNKGTYSVTPEDIVKYYGYTQVEYL